MNNAIEFKSPKQYEIVMKLSSGKVIKGMGIPKGITLIVEAVIMVNQHYLKR